MPSFSRLDDTIAYDSKPIAISEFCPDDASQASPLIFAHGAGGSMNADGVANFRDGFAAKHNLIAFQGNMNLKSRVKMFKVVIDYHAQSSKSDDLPILGGRSMGARAAVIAATESFEDTSSDSSVPVADRLILVSYPLQDGKEHVRDQILFDIPASFSVLFISGDKDSMCDLSHLRTVRKKMKCKSWMVTVENASHGMDMRPKSSTAQVGNMTGVVAATWLESRDDKLTETEIIWNADEEEAQCRSWHAQELDDVESNTASTGREVLADAPKENSRRNRTKANIARKPAQAADAMDEEANSATEDESLEAQRSITAKGKQGRQREATKGTAPKRKRNTKEVDGEDDNISSRTRQRRTK